MNVSEKLKSTVEDAARHIGIDTKSKDHSVKTEKPVAREAPLASFAHVDYSKLAILKPTTSPVGSATLKAVHAAATTMKDPSVRKDLAAVKTVAAPLIMSGGATIGAAAGAAKAVITMVKGAETMAGALGSAQVELAPIGAASFALAEVAFVRSALDLNKALPKAIHDARVAAPVVREAAHHMMETFKKNAGR